MSNSSIIRIALSAALTLLMLAVLLPAAATAATTVTDYALPQTNSNPDDICLGPDGAMWFTEETGNRIGRVDGTGQVTNEYTVPTGSSQLNNIVAGPDGNLWFTEENFNHVGKITASGDITEYDVAGIAGGPSGICVGPDNSIWFTDQNVGNNYIARMTTAGVVTNQFVIPNPSSQAVNICSGPDGNLWFVEHDQDKICKMTTAGAVTEFTLASGSAPQGICSGPDGNLWFTAADTNKVGSITTGGLITQYDLPVGTGPWGICSANGTLWVAGYDGNTVVKVTTAGGSTAYTVHTAASGPNKLCAGPGSSVWFTEWAMDKVGRITTLSAPTVTAISPDWGSPGSTITVTDLAGTNFSGTPIVRLNRTGSTDITATNVLRTSSNKLTCRFAIPTNAAKAAWDVYVQNPDGQNAEKAAIFTVANEGKHTWYLAEGTTAWGFSTYVSITNPNTSALAAKVTYMPKGASTVTETVPLPANSQTTLTNDHLLSAMGGPRDFSTKVECTDHTRTIAVDRTMYWTGQGASAPEAHCSVGVTSPANTWYLPEGSSQWGFETWLLIQNPQGSAATCTVTYMLEGGQTIQKVHVIPPNSRDSFSMADEISSRDASIKVVSDSPVIPERAMYRNARREGHDSIGTTTPAPKYYLAEGTTAWGFTTYVLIQNPNADAANVTVSYLTEGGAKPQPSISIPGNSRKTIRVNDNPDMANTDFSTTVSADKNIIAERAMYWNSEAGEACHDSIGMDSPHTTFYLPDGQADASWETWTLVQNPNTSNVNVTVTYLPAGGGTPVVRKETIGASSRKTFGMAAHSHITGRASIVVTCNNAGKKIMVERSMYMNSRRAGTDTIGGYSD